MTIDELEDNLIKYMTLNNQAVKLVREQNDILAKMLDVVRNQCDYLNNRVNKLEEAMKSSVFIGDQPRISFHEDNTSANSSKVDIIPGQISLDDDWRD